MEHNETDIGYFKKLINSADYQEETALVDRESMDDVVARIGDRQARLLHHSIGIAGEGGELVDAIKKHVFYGKTLDTENVVEECGDLLWYMTRLLDTLGFTLEEAMTHNNIKLKKRYEKGYSDKAAQERADKQ